MTGEVWFAVLPDGEAGLAAARALLPQASRVIPHASGRPWLMGDWPDGQVTVAAAGEARLAVVGRCPVTAGALAARLRPVREVSDVEEAVRGLAGSFHVVASVAGRVRVRGSASAVRRVFHARIDGATVAAGSPSRLASLTGAEMDESVLALSLLSVPVFHPLDNRCVWRGVQALGPDQCLLIERDGRARTARWWQPPQPVLSRTEGAAAVRRALVDAVESCTTGGGTISADLSGGMDSTSLCFLAARGPARLVTLHLTGVDPDNDDTTWATGAAAALPDSEHLRPEHAQLPTWLAGIGSLDVSTDEPGGWVRDVGRCAALIPLLVGRGSRLHLVGIGGDELFCALPPHLHDYIRSHPLAAIGRMQRQRAAESAPLWPVLRELADRSTYARWLTAEAGRLAVPPPSARGRELPSPAWGPELRMPPWASPEAVDLVHRLLREAADGAEPLAPQRGQHAALTYVQTGGRGIRHMNQVTTGLGLEYAAPYLDDNVIEAALSVRVHERNAPHRFKPVLATAMRGIMPDPLLERRTKGDFTADFHAGLRANKAALLRLFDDSRLARAGLIDADAVRASLIGPQTGPDAQRLMEPTLACEAWLRSRPDPLAPPRAAVPTGERP
ncbi:asparagine synthase-related protein [Streptoverticillium reticulum]|uniref:asparagine synthase-related protein n=1 Tax=Streptoverticillium reticulum TaxID=1433415 RepID=UPI0039BFDFEE